MKGLRDWKIVWPNAKKVQVSKVKTLTPIRTVAAMCRNLILDGGEINYHFFMNSVWGIKEAVEKGGLSPDNCRIICADNKENRAKLPKGFSISTPGDPAKPINFYTSTCFEGCDILDENGRTFIVCDPHRPNTLLDISTSMLQICGRIRNSRFRGQMTLIFNTTRYEEEETLDQFIKRIERETAEAEENAA